LVSSTTDGKVTHYAYDAAGRLIKEGDKSYAYGWLDKVLSVTENGQQIASFNYHNDGQIAQAIHDGKSEDFLWDGLALIHRGENSFINEPYVTGGNPILSSNDGVMFNDMLGSTLNIGGKAINMTAFGESADSNAMYTGKPYIGELGYAFLFRNYRSDYGKWQTTDPLGYPDGWNNLAYVNNGVIGAIDWLGGIVRHYVDTEGGIAGSGHSAWVVGNNSIGYTVYDYGPESSSGSGRVNRTGNFNTMAEAEAFLQQGRNGSNFYDKAQDFVTTPAQDNGFIQDANIYMKQNYNLETHNCFQLGYDGLSKQGVDIDLHRGFSPNKAYDANNTGGFARPVTVRYE